MYVRTYIVQIYDNYKDYNYTHMSRFKNLKTTTNLSHAQSDVIGSGCTCTTSRPTAIVSTMGSICIQLISVARLAWFAVVLGGWYSQDNCEGFHECIGHSRCNRPLRIEDNDTPTGEMYYRTLYIHIPEHLII